jgi:hypothetical protein
VVVSVILAHFFISVFIIHMREQAATNSLTETRTRNAGLRIQSRMRRVTR